MNDVSADFVGRFDELHRVAYRASFVVLGQREDAQDCAQEALARTLAHWPTVADHAVPWVARVATNLALDRARWQARRRRADRRRSPATSEVVHPTDIADESVVRSSGVESAAGRSGSAESDVSTARHDLAVALRSLPRRQRDAVVLRHLLGLSEQETATAMGCSVGTVKSSTSRALDALRRALGPAWNPRPGLGDPDWR